MKVSAHAPKERWPINHSLRLRRLHAYVTINDGYIQGQVPSAKCNRAIPLIGTYLLRNASEKLGRVGSRLQGFDDVCAKLGTSAQPPAEPSIISDAELSTAGSRVLSVNSTYCKGLPVITLSLALSQNLISSPRGAGPLACGRALSRTELLRAMLEHHPWQE